MTKQDILDKAKYIMFPYNNESYAEWLINTDIAKKAVKMPVIPDEANIQYDYMANKNQHHYTTYYHYTYVLPILAQILNFRFNINDFNIIKAYDEISDVSYMVPKNESNLTVYSFNHNITKNVKYSDLMPIQEHIPGCYRYFYKYFHECSRIVNNDLQNNRKLLISGDSQMIPDILPLTQYFKEVWYMDNRTGHYLNDKTNKMDIDYNKLISFADKYKDTDFDDVLIEIYSNPLFWYLDINLY